MQAAAVRVVATAVHLAGCLAASRAATVQAAADWVVATAPHLAGC